MIIFDFERFGHSVNFIIHMECVEGVVSGNVGGCVFVKTPVSGVAEPIIFEVTQSLKSLLVQGCGFVSSKEVCMKHAPGLFSSLGLLVFFHMLPRRGWYNTWYTFFMAVEKAGVNGPSYSSFLSVL